jgi:hypothetical protein
VSSLSPSSGPAGGGTTVTITGTNLADATAVDFGSAAATIVTDSATSITATSPTGSGTVDVTVTTAAGTSATSPSDRFTFVTTGAFQITTTSLPAGVAGVPYHTGEAYSVQLEAANTGGQAVTWHATHLPFGLYLSASGLLHGTPSAETTGNRTVVVTATDGPSGPTAQATIPIVIDELPSFVGGTAKRTTFTSGAAGTSTIRARGFPAPTFTVTGTLPSGVTIDPATGVLTYAGTPTGSTSATVTVTVANGIGSPASEQYVVAVAGGVVITTTSADLPVVAPGGSIPGGGYQLEASGLPNGSTPQWRRTSLLPAGLHLSSSGLLSGTLASSVTPGQHTFSVLVSARVGGRMVTATATLTLTVATQISD